MALKHFGKVLAKSELVDSEDKQSIYLDHHIKTLFQKFDDWNKALEGFKFRNEAQCLNDHDFKKAIVKAIFLHDLGKISYEFQDKITKSALNKRVIDDLERKEILESLKESKEIKLGRHEVYSCIWSLLFLPENDSLSSKIKTAILYHHYNDFYSVDIENGLRVFEDNDKEVIEYLKNLVKPNGNKMLDFINELEQKIKKENFSNIVKDVLRELKYNFENNLKNKGIENIIEAFKEDENISLYLNFYDPALLQPQIKILTSDDYEFILLLGWLRRCDYSGSANVIKENDSSLVLNELEEKVKNFDWQKELIKKVDCTKHTILVAPTGSGKTEFAFLWAGLDKKRKLIYTLPLRVALNDIYNIRLRDGYLKNFNNFDEYVSLLHSTAFLEDLSRIEKESLNIEAKETSSKLLNSSLVLSTADQVLLSSLFYYGFDKLFSIYPYSSFVIDEIQSYSPEMIAVILKTLHHIDKLGGRILIMTATLPPFLNEALKLDGVGLDDKFQNLESEVEKISNEVKNFNLKRHKLAIRDDSLVKLVRDDIYKSNTKIVDEIKKRSKNNNILVIFNNIIKAIKFYKELKTQSGNGDKIFLLHARLLEKEKRDRIACLKEKLKNGEKGLILVSTQIVEASVDIDFDILYTEMSPIDSQIQRWGRVYRNREKDYRENDPNVFIFLCKEEEDESLRLSKIIYSEDIMNATISYFEKNSSVLKNKVLSYKEEKELLGSVFNNDVLNKYINSIKENLEFLSYFKVSKRSEAQRIFRKLAGRYVVFIDAMKKYGNSNEKKLAEFISEIWENRNLEKSWKEICKNIYNDYTPNLKYEIKKMLFDYSINIPEFYFLKLFNEADIKEFKGFYIYSGVEENNLEFLKELGFDAIKEEIEVQELQLSSSDQFI